MLDKYLSTNLVELNTSESIEIDGGVHPAVIIAGVMAAIQVGTSLYDWGKKYADDAFDRPAAKH
ncbi:MAG: hypothetical protein U5M51_07165 [Emticicia sp.]|nr:hypothetical protein [Emticicia sp.]